MIRVKFTRDQPRLNGVPGSYARGEVRVLPNGIGERYIGLGHERIGPAVQSGGAAADGKKHRGPAKARKKRSAATD